MEAAMGAANINPAPPVATVAAIIPTPVKKALFFIF
jgi:hypothetical protein